MLWLHGHSYTQHCDLPCLESGIKTAARTHEEVDLKPGQLEHARELLLLQIESYRAIMMDDHATCTWRVGRWINTRLAITFYPSAIRAFWRGRSDPSVPREPVATN